MRAAELAKRAVEEGYAGPGQKTVGRGNQVPKVSERRRPPRRVDGNESHESEDVRPRALHLGGEQARHIRALHQLRHEETAQFLSTEGGGAQEEGDRGGGETILNPAIERNWMHVRHNYQLIRQLFQ